MSKRKSMSLDYCMCFYVRVCVYLPRPLQTLYSLVVSHGPQVEPIDLQQSVTCHMHKRKSHHH